MSTYAAEGRSDLVHVGDVFATHLVNESEQPMAIEVDPDERAGDPALAARERTDVGRTEGVDRSLLASDRVGHCLKLCELVLADQPLLFGRCE